MLKKSEKTNNKPIILLYYICNKITFMLQKLFVSMQFLNLKHAMNVIHVCSHSVNCF